MYVKRYCEARSHNYFCSTKAISIVYSEYVFIALVIQHAKRMRVIILSSLAGPVLQNFSYITSTSARFSE
jgi:hypothetical protein